MNLTRKPFPERFSLLKNRILPILLAALMLLPVCYLSSLTGLGYSASLSAKDTVCPGYAYILRVSLDEAAIGFQGRLSYDSSVLTLDKVVPVNLDLQDEFHVYSETGMISITHDEPVRKMLSITFWVAADAEIGSKTVVRFTSCEVIHADGSEKLSDVSFTFTVVDGRSSDTTLSGLTVSLYANKSDFESDSKGVNAILQPTFSSGKRAYEANAPYQYAYFRVKPVAADANAELEGTLDGELTAGESCEILITVTAEDGTRGTYTVDLFRESKPDIPDESSQDISVPSSDSEEPSEIPDDSSETPSEPSTSEDESEESEPMATESDTTESSVSASSSTPSVSIPTTSYGRLEPQSDNWTGIILGIAAIGGLVLIVLLIRILVLFRKKQK